MIQKASPTAVVAAFQAGMTGATIAAAYGITRERVRQIVKRDLGTGLRRHEGTLCLYCRVPVGDPAHAASHAEAIRVRREARFWGRVRKMQGGCWIWVGASRTAGYGAVRLLPGDGGYAHRAAYILAKGPIPAGYTIDHLCRNRGCVNPAHLDAVTPRENVLRSPIARAAINARKTHCKRGHLFDAANTRYRLEASGHLSRSCRACRRRDQQAAA